MVHAAQTAAEPPMNANNRQCLIRSTSSAGRCDRAVAVVRTRGQRSGLACDSRRSKLNYYFEVPPASSFCGVGKQPLGVEDSFRLRVTWDCLWNRAFKIKLARPNIGLFR